MSEQIKNYYENYDEEGRLFRDKAHLPEWLTTIRYFDRLFMPGSQILDACAGTGRYSFYLVEKGHIVTSCDLVEHNVNIIKMKPNADKLVSISVCNVLDLSLFEENSFDIVLCMGALYHLSTEELREKAISECVRVCKVGGIVVLAYIIEHTNIIEDKYVDFFFCTTPSQIERIAVTCGLKKIYSIGTDGIINILGNKLKEANDEDFSKYMEAHYMTCEDESIINASIHGLWIGRKT